MDNLPAWLKHLTRSKPIRTACGGNALRLLRGRYDAAVNPYLTADGPSFDDSSPRLKREPSRLSSTTSPP